MKKEDKQESHCIEEQDSSAETRNEDKQKSGALHIEASSEEDIRVEEEKEEEKEGVEEERQFAAPQGTLCAIEEEGVEDEMSEEDMEHRMDIQCGEVPAGVLHIRLAQGERRGWWQDHDLPKNEMTQAFVRGAIDDLEMPLMLDTGANISLLHTNLARKLGLKVKMFDSSSEFYGISEHPMKAHGMTTAKVKLGASVVYEMEFWVAEFEASTLVIIGTDFMLRAGLTIDLYQRRCRLPHDGDVPLLDYDDVKGIQYRELHCAVEEASDEPLQWASYHAVACVGDTPPAVFTVDALPVGEVDQSKLAKEVYMREGVEMSAESMAEQLAMIPEFDEGDGEPVDIGEAVIGEGDVSKEDIELVKETLERKKNNFISSGNALPPPAKGIVCDVDVGDANPIAQKTRQVPPHLMGRLYELLRGLLRAGLIRFSSSPWASPIVIVLKKNGKDIRLCIDYRMVNSLTKLMVYPMPLVDDLLDNFAGIMWFCSLDNASGFWAIPLTMRARLITAFICPLGHFEWMRMPQGLKNAPQIYQRMIDNALWSMVRRLSVKRSSTDGKGRLLTDPVVTNAGFGVEEGVTVTVPEAAEGYSVEMRQVEDAHRKVEDVGSTEACEGDVFTEGVPEAEDVSSVINRRSYIDDITFGSTTWVEMNEMLGCLLDAFEYWGITVSLRKSAFGRRSVEFLSHKIERDGLRSVPRNLESIKEMPFPSTQKGLQKFIGSLVYYHRFIENFATYAAALYEITDVRIKDGTQLDHARKAFEELKKKLCEAPLLRHVERNRELVVVLYTNRWAFGAAVCQDHDGTLHPVRYVSKVFKDAESRYTPSEQEVLALLKVLHVASHYLLGQPITVYARYSTLKWVFTSKSLTGRVVQWAAMLSPWSLTIVRSDKTPAGLLAVLAASVTPAERMDEVLEEITPMKMIYDTPTVRPLPELRRDTAGYLVTFDGAVKVKEPRMGSYGMVLWKLPEWEPVAAEYEVKDGLTVNDSEYHGLMGALELATRHGVKELVVCGDSRIVIGQATGDLRCNQASLQVWLNRVKEQLTQFDSVSFAHIPRKFNYPADLLTRKGMVTKEGGRISSETEMDDLKKLNTLPELLYRTVDEDDASRGGTDARTSQVEDPQVFVVSKATSKKKQPQTTNAAQQEATVNEQWTPLHVSEEALLDAQAERLRRIAKLQREDEWCSLMIAYLEGDLDPFPSSTALKRVAKAAVLYVLDSASVLYYCAQGRKDIHTFRLVVPAALQEDVLHAYHTELGGGAHQGVNRVFERLKRLYHWRGMYADVEWFVSSCEDCASGKGKPRYKGRSTGNLVATRPFQILAMDFAIPLPKTYAGNEAMLCCICLFTGYVILVPMADTSAQSVAEAYLAGVFSRFGAQEMVRHDRDPRFMSSVFTRFNRMMRQKQRPTLSYRPQANGKQERSVQTVVRAIKCYVSDAGQRDWDEYVKQLELALNTSVNLQYGQTSFYLVHGWEARTQLESVVPPKDGSVKEKNALAWRQKVLVHQEKAQAHAEFIQLKLMEARAAANNERVADVSGTIRTEYQPGELVWLYHELVKEGLVRKLAHLWHGPYMVEERVNESVYKLKIDRKDSQVLPMVHISRLKPYVSRLKRPRDKTEPQGALELDEALLPEDSWFEPDEGDEFEVEEVLDCRYKQRTRNARRQKEYYVKWVGYEEPTWEPEENLSCTALLFEFDAGRAWESRREAAQTTGEEELEEWKESEEENGQEVEKQ